MRKYFLIPFLIGVLLSHQALLPLNTIANTIKDEDLVLSLKEILSTGEVIVLVENASTNVLDNVTIKLPDNLEFNTKTQSISDNIEWSYDTFEKTVTLLQIDQTEEQIPLKFSNISAEQFSLTAIGKFNETTIQSNELKVVLPIEEIKKDNTALENNETAGETEIESIAVESKDEITIEKVEKLKEQPVNDTSAFDISEAEILTNQIGENANLTNPNVELYVESLQDTVLSGKTANFQLTLKVTGAEAVYENIKLEVDLPQHPHIPTGYPQLQNNIVSENLRINGQLPTYDEQNQKLVYDFLELSSGQVYQTIISVKPENGLTPVSDENDYIRHLQINATISKDSSSISKQAQVQVLSDLELILTKHHVETKRLVDGVYKTVNELARPGDYTIWEIKYAVPYKSSGMTYIAPDTNIIIYDVFEEAELQFDPALQNEGFSGVHNSDGAYSMMVWRITTPSLEEQKSITSGNLVEGSFKVVLKVNEELPETKRVVYNNVSMGVPALSLSNESIARYHNTYHYAEIARIETPTEPLENGYYPGFFGGAFDSIGNPQDMYYYYGLGSVPKVTDKALLSNKIHYQIHPAGFDIYKNDVGPINGGSTYLNDVVNFGYKEFIAESTIDEKLDMTHLFLEVPYMSYRVNAPDTGFELTPIPTAYVQLKINGQWQSEYPAQFRVDKTKLMLDLLEYGKSKGDHVEAYRIIYRDISGKSYISALAYFNVYEGERGLATNTIKYNFMLNNGDTYALLPPNDPTLLDNHRSSDKHIEIVDYDEFDPTVSTAIKIIDIDNGPLQNSNVSLGLNRIEVQYVNNTSSATLVEGPIELVVALPQGVHLDNNINFESDVLLRQTTLNSEPVPVEAKYQLLDTIDGQEYVKITFDNSRLMPGEKLTARFNVNITNMAFSHLNMQVYGYSQTPNVLVPANTSNILTASSLEIDVEDFNKSGLNTEQRVKSANYYNLIKQNNLQVKKEVKGEKDQIYTNFGYTIPGGNVDYRFTLTNTTGTDIETFTLIDVLPSVSDRGITDNVERDSQFEVTLRKPINFVDTKWNDKVTVYYSTSKNPVRDDLYENVKFPTGSTQYPNPDNAEQPNWMLEEDISDWSTIHSFKIVMKDGVDWIEGQDVTFEIFAIAADVTFDSELLNTDIKPTQRAAWNSFAATANELLPVEPLKVGVALVPKTGQLKITKVDAETRALLEGTEFELYQLKCIDESNNYIRCEDAQPIATQVTDSDGLTTFKNIPFGYYELIESKSTTGYKLFTSPIRVNIFNEEAQHLTVENEKNTWELPHTGGIGTMLYSYLGIIIICISWLLVYRKNKKTTPKVSSS